MKRLDRASNLDIQALAESAARESRLDFKAGSEVVDGQTWPAIRPSIPERPNGLCIAYLRIPDSLIVHLALDNFARELLATIEKGSKSAEAAALWASATPPHVRRAELLVNDVAYVALESIPTEAWHTFSMRVESSTVGAQEAQVFERALEATLFSIAMLLEMVPHEETEAEDPEIADDEPGLPEGASKRVLVNRYERSRRNRMACLASHGFSCRACGMRFQEVYGEIGRDYIEVHHTVPVSKMGGSYKVDPVRDLVPLCSNCHRMVHRRNPPYSPDELHDLIETNSES